MKINVRMLAFMDGEIREVNLPDDEFARCEGTLDVLSLTFRYGQNDFQPINDRCSVSVGDVIEYDGGLYVVCTTGFRKLSQQEYDEYLKVERPSRSLHVMMKMKSNVT